jgi:hypothetical protein
VQGNANTFWTDGQFATMPFVNVPFGTSGGLIRLGTFTVTPEPSLCLLVGTCGLGAWRLVRRQQPRGG